MRRLRTTIRFAVSRWWYFRDVTDTVCLVANDYDPDGIVITIETDQRFKRSIDLRLSIREAAYLVEAIPETIGDRR